MPDSRGLLFVVNERQRRSWLEAERRRMYARADAPPPAAEGQRSNPGHRLAFRLRLIIRPTGG